MSPQERNVVVTGLIVLSMLLLVLSTMLEPDAKARCLKSHAVTAEYCEIMVP